nr:outer membrane protein transport protein [Spongiibacter thalassae]
MPVTAGDVDLKLPQNAKDHTIVAIGASYAATQNLTLRAGYRQATQPFNDEGLLALIPAVLKRHATLGISYQVSKSGRFDAAYSRAFEHSMTNQSDFNTSSAVRSSIAQDNFVFGYTHSF